MEDDQDEEERGRNEEGVRVVGPVCSFPRSRREENDIVFDNQGQIVAKEYVNGGIRAPGAISHPLTGSA